MVARLVRDQEVVGSNPVASTKKQTDIFVCLFFDGNSLRRDLRVETRAGASGLRGGVLSRIAREQTAPALRAVRRGAPPKAQIPSPRPKKHLNFDTMGIKIAVLSFCLNGLISRAFRLLRCLLLPGRTIARRQSSAQRHRMAVGYRLFLGLPFNLWAIVYS